MPAGPPIIYPIEEVIEKLNKFIERAKAGKVKPRQVTFRKEYGISKTRLHELSKKNDEIANSLEQLNDLEEEHLVEGGETGKIPAPFAKFRLMQKPFNYSENVKQESHNTNENTNNNTNIDLSHLTTDQIRELLKK